MLFEHAVMGAPMCTLAAVLGYRDKLDVVYKLMRPELVRASRYPLDSDTFVGWSGAEDPTERQEHQDHVRECCQELLPEKMAECAQELERYGATLVEKGVANGGRWSMQEGGMLCFQYGEAHSDLTAYAACLDMLAVWTIRRERDCHPRDCLCCCTGSGSICGCWGGCDSEHVRKE